MARRVSALGVAQLVQVGDVVHANREKGGQAQELFGARGKVLGVAGGDAGEDGEVVDCGVLLASPLCSDSMRPTKLARRADGRAAHEQNALPQQGGLLQPEDQRAKQRQILRDGQRGVVLGQPLLVVALGLVLVLVLCHRRDCRLLRLRPARLVRPEVLQRRNRLVRRQGRRQLLQLAREQPAAPQPAEPPLAPDQNPDRDEVGVAVRLARVAPGECAQPGVARVRKVDEVARQRVQARRQ